VERKTSSISDQIKERLLNAKAKGDKPPHNGDTSRIVSTGSTLLDLAISGGRVRGGGVPGGILVEIFGPAGCGKTVMLCELAGAVQRQGGQVMFKDPEARLNKQFAQLFDMDVNEIDYSMPSTVPEVFAPIRKWQPEGEGVVHGIFADSLAALSTEWEMNDKDQYGMRRAKEFSEELRKTCRIITEKGFLLACSNQVRQNLDAGPYGQKFKSPGGEAIGFYASLRLRCGNPRKLKKTRKIAGKDVDRIYGVETEVEVYKSSVWEPYRTAPVYIIFDYGIDDIRANLQFVKTSKDEKVYVLGEEKLDKSIDKAIAIIEQDDRVDELREEVIELWQEIEEKFKTERRGKRIG